jgi:hypothetical protein
MSQINHEYKLFTKQREFFNSKAPICYLCCGRGYGKSHIASLYTVIQFLEGKRIIAMAQNYKALTEVLFAEIMKRLIELNIPYKFDKSMMKITYGTGAIFGFSYENIDSVRGLTEISIAVCDEAALSPSTLFATLAPCLRGEGITPYIRLLSTPRRGSWINLYVKEHPDSVQVIQAKTTDNPLITQEQLQLMRSAIVNQDLIEQELEGKMLDIDSDSSILQLRDYPAKDYGQNGPCYMGMDLAGLGSDSNVLTVVSRYRIEEQISIRVADTFELADTAERMARRWDVKGIFIDVTGSTSCGVLDVLRAKGMQVTGINFAQKPFEDDIGKKCANARAEMYVNLSNAVKSGLYVEDEDIKTQLAYTTIFVNKSGKLQLIPKDQIKELIGHSPDQADSFALAVYAMEHKLVTPTVEEERKHASEVAARYMTQFHLYNDID